jgi:hypothetical protein
MGGRGSRKRGRRRKPRSRLSNNAKKQRNRLLKRLKTPYRGIVKLLKYPIQITSVRINLGVVHQRMQPQKLPHHPHPELLHRGAASPYLEISDSKNWLH